MLTGLKLLLVEDDEDDYILTRDLLEELHPGQVRLDWVDSVDRALDALRTRDHDLCLVDFQLGEDNGLHLIQQARAEEIPTPVIMLTGHHDTNLDIEAQHAGAVDYLVKSELNSSSLGRSIRYARARSQAEEERVHRLHAESQNRSKTQFLTHLSHELRTPLTSILGYTELLLMKEQESKKLQELRTIERNGRHLLSLLNDILDLSKIEAGKLDLDIRAVRLEELLADVQSQLAVRAKEKNITLNIEGIGDLPETIHTDRIRLQQILINLLINGIKFTDVGGVNLLVRVIAADDGREQMEFQIIDTGVGISAATQKLIFEPFSQAQKNGESHRDSGFGLGLPISLELAKKLGGAIHCQSKPGVGSTFTLTLDIGDVADVVRRPLNLTERVDLPITTSQVTLTGRVLIVDDLADVRQLLGAVLIRTGAEVLFARNGREAIETVLSRENSSEAIDTVIMDLQMPVMDGLTALQTLRGKDFKGPVIALTASAMQGERERCLQAGFSAYLGKPIDIETLISLLSTYLADQPANSAPQRIQPGSDPKGTVLLVEDDEDARRATTKLITHLGWRVLAVANASEALTCVADKADAISLALIDLGLPDIDGYELTRQIRATQIHTPRIIALSGAQSDQQRLQQSGFDSHILKPISLQQLRDVLQGVGNEA